jgi:hypothetical protein
LVPTTTGYQEQPDSPTAHQAALNAVLADWSSTTDFARQVARILDEGPAKGPLHRVGLKAIDQQNDFWSSISGINEIIDGLTMGFGRNFGRG